jgi:carbamoyl-phosphate synthase large subunit
MSSERTHALLTCAGRKAYVLDALLRSPQAGRVWLADSNPLAEAAARHEHFVVLPAASAADYVERLLEICARERIDCVLPTNDLDLTVLGAAGARLARAGVRLLGPGAATVEALSDKLLAARWLAERGFATPETWSGEKADEALERHGLPLVAKARRGQGSEGLLVCHAPADLRRVAPGSVLQPRALGPEFNLDILRGPRGVVSVVPKRKLEMFAGGTQRAESVDAPELVELGVRLGEALGHLGSVDVDLMLEADGPSILDVNPRLGGGFPFTALFCPRYVDALLEIGRGGSPAPFLGEYRRGLRAFREFRYALGS